MVAPAGRQDKDPPAARVKNFVMRVAVQEYNLMIEKYYYLAFIALLLFVNWKDDFRFVLRKDDVKK